MSTPHNHPLIAWFESHAKPFFAKHAPQKIDAIDSDRNRLASLLARSDDVTVCFLGHSGVGKSTLLNALVAKDQQVLPAGGIGPLTAQATEVHYSPDPTFRVTYHPKTHLWRMVFALETRLRRQQKIGTQKEAASSDSPGEEILLTAQLSEDAKKEAEFDATSTEISTEDGTRVDSLEGYIKQAKNMVCGTQFIEKPLEYLVDALRLACHQKPAWNQEPDAEDHKRVLRISKILKDEKSSRTHERRGSPYDREFMEELKAHAAGFLSPLIERIEVGWPAEVLKSGVKLVDLPGVGIAQDSYRDVTKAYVREKARAVIVVVDRAGPTEATIDLLRTSGYWDRLVGSADDPTSDPCSLLIAVTKVDDVTQEEYLSKTSNLAPGETKPKRKEIFAQLVAEFVPRMRMQVSEQLSKIETSTNEAVQTARIQARETLLKNLEIHPVSAPEWRRLINEDEDDRPFLSDPNQTGVPNLQATLNRLAEAEKQAREDQIREVSERLSSTLLSELQVMQASWQQDNRAAEEAARLASELEKFLKPKEEEYRSRAAAFREFLETSIQAKIEALVHEAREVAERDVNVYLFRLSSAHWSTLRAAVRRGGTFYGSRNINLPDDISGYFQEPMAAVWGQKLLKVIRTRTTDLANDIQQMVGEICDWAKTNAGTALNTKMLEAQQKRVVGLASQMKAVGKEAVDEMREVVKNELTATIRNPIKTACEKFVRDGDDYGPGVKHRVLELFRHLAREATSAAREPTTRILKQQAAHVRDEIQAEFKKGGNPLQETADLIIERHEDRVRRSDAQKRKAVLAEIESVLERYPLMSADLTASGM